MFAFVKQNRALLTFLGILSLIFAGLMLPNFLECEGFGLKTASEMHAEALEMADMRTVLSSSDYHTIHIGTSKLTFNTMFDAHDVEVDRHTLRLILDSQAAEPGSLWPVGDAWATSYMKRHRLTPETVPCLRIVIFDRRGARVYSGVSKSSIYTLFFGEHIW